MEIMRVATVYEPEADALPAEFGDVLTEQDVTLAGRDSPKWLRNIFAECADSGYELQFYSFGDEPYRPTFGSSGRACRQSACRGPNRCGPTCPRFFANSTG